MASGWKWQNSNIIKASSGQMNCEGAIGMVALTQQCTNSSMDMVALGQQHWDPCSHVFNYYTPCFVLYEWCLHYVFDVDETNGIWFVFDCVMSTIFWWFSVYGSFVLVCLLCWKFFLRRCLEEFSSFFSILLWQHFARAVGIVMLFVCWHLVCFVVIFDC